MLQLPQGPQQLQIGPDPKAHGRLGLSNGEGPVQCLRNLLHLARVLHVK